MSPSRTSMRSGAICAATERARSAKRGSTRAATRSFASVDTSDRTTRVPMKPGNPVKKISPPAMRARSLRGCSSLHLVEVARLDLVDESADRFGAWHERIRLEPADRLAHALLEAFEGVRRPGRLLPRRLLHPGPE